MTFHEKISCFVMTFWGMLPHGFKVEKWKVFTHNEENWSFSLKCASNMSFTCEKKWSSLWMFIMKGVVTCISTYKPSPYHSNLASTLPFHHLLTFLHFGNLRVETSSSPFYILFKCDNGMKNTHLFKLSVAIYVCILLLGCSRGF